MEKLQGTWLLLALLAATPLAAAPGELDPAFSPTVDNRVFAIRVDANGRSLIGGQFRNVNGVAHNRIARLNADGSLDASFNAGDGASDTVLSIEALPDGKIVAAGRFVTFANQSHGRIVRLTETGQVDPGFNPGGSGFDNIVERLIPVSGGKLLAVGAFTKFNGAAAPRIIRLNPDGTRDASFQVGSGPNSTVRDAVELPDGKLIVVGHFTSFAGRNYGRVVRLNADGSVDNSFVDPAATGNVIAVARQRVGGTDYLVIGGAFARVGSPSHVSVRMARLRLDGTPDRGFNNPGFNTDVLQIGIQANNSKIIAAGTFTSVDGASNARVVRLNADGTHDATFQTGTAANNAVRSFDLADWVFAGDFTSFDGTPRGRVARLQNDVPTPTVITVQPSPVTTVEGGTAAFSVTASGVVPLTYQWFADNAPLSDGGDISGATTATLTIANAAEADEADYRVVVTAADGAGDSVTSDAAALTVNPNVPPSIDAVANRSVPEDSVNQLIPFTGVSAGPAYESFQNVTITAASSDPSIVPHPTVNYVSGAATGSLSVSPVAEQNGVVTITLTVTDNGQSDTTTVRSFDLTVTRVNDRPTLANVPASLSAVEDQASIISGVTANDIDNPTLEMTVSVLNGTVQLTGAIPPGINQSDSDGSDGNITFDGPIASINSALASSIRYLGAPNYNGSDTLTFTVDDRDAVEPRSASASITILVAPVNDAPSVTLATTEVGAPAGSGAQTVENFAGFSPGPTDEAGQTVVGYTVTAATPGFFTVQPAIDANGRLTFTPSGANGSSTVTVRVQDSGGTDRGGVDLSAPRQFTISVSQNQPPTIDPIPNQTVAEDSGPTQITLTGISEGTPFESSQTLSISAQSNIPGIIDHPSVTHVEDSDTATLTFAPAPRVTGTVRITVTLTDNGPSNRTTTRTFDISVTPDNDAPILSNVPANGTVNEDTPLIISGVTMADEDDHSLRVTLSAPNGVVALSPTNPPGITYIDAQGADGTLVFTGTIEKLNEALATSIRYSGQPHYHGPDTLTVSITDLHPTDPKSAQASMAITVNPVNDAPTVTLAQAGFNHEAGTTAAQNIAGFAGFSPGPNNESSQSLISYTVIVSDASIFSSVPTISNAGLLNYTPNGSAGLSTITVTARDNGGTANGGTDVSVPVSFTVGVDIANEPPVVTIDPAQLNGSGALELPEDAPAQARVGFLSELSPGVGESATQTLTEIALTTDNDPLFAALPALTGDGTTLEFTLAPDANGTANVTIRVTDDGPTINGQPVSTTRTFAIVVAPINDAPGLNRGPDVVVNEDSGPQNIAAWATGVTAGAHNESDVISVNVTAADPTLFAVQPALDLLTGNLSFTPAPDAFGSTAVTIRLTDDGPAEAPNQNAAEILFNLMIHSVNDRPVVLMAANGGGQLVRNGGFETGDFTAWNLIKDNPGFPGQQSDWENITPGIRAERRARARFDSAFGTQILYQDVTLPDSAAARLSFELGYVATQDWIVGNSLYTRTVPAEPGEVNQQIRVDVIKPTAAHFSTAPADVLATAFITQPGDPLHRAPAKVALDLTAFGGQTVRLRFAVAVSQAPVEVFLDEVKVETFGQLLGATAVDGAGAQTVPGFAAVTSRGADNESGQGGAFQIIANSNPGLFDVPPAIDAGGVLTYTPQAGQRGSAVISFVFTDDGGTANGGADTSEVHTFFISVGGARVYVDGSPGIVGNAVAVEIDLDSAGNENSVGFSFTYDPATLVFDGASLGADANGASLFSNGDVPGQLGLVVALPTEQSFAAGNRHLVTLNFTRAPTSATTGRSPLGFGDSPVLRQVTSADASILADVIFVGSELILSETVEGDVAPRPFGSGAVTVADATQVARFVVGLDQPNLGSEFQRTDTAPLGTSGDGILSVADWVQTLRFAAALDTPGAVGGPDRPANQIQPSSLRAFGFASRTVGLRAGVLAAGATSTIRLVINATGDEAAVSCTLRFDPAVLSYVGHRLGGGATGGVLIVNSNQAAVGTLGIVLGLPAGSTLTAGEQVLAELDFNVVGGAGATAIHLAGSPVAAEVADSFAGNLPASFQGGAFPVQLPAGFRPVGVAVVNGRVRLVFGNDDGSPVTPAQISGLTVYAANNIVATSWRRLDNALTIVDGQVQIVDADAGSLRFYRVLREVGTTQ